MENTNKKSKAWKWVLSGFAIAAITAGVGVGVGYAIWHNRSNTPPSTDVINFGHYEASMTSGSQTISALSSLDNQVALTADGEGRNIAWTFNNENNTLTYEKVINKTTVTITADDNITTNSIHIDLLPPAVPSFSVNCTNPNLTVDTTSTLALTWAATNFTPTRISLSTDNSSDTTWDLDGGTSPIKNVLTLSRKDPNLAAQVYNVYLDATDDTTTETASIAITISVPIEKDLFFTTGDTTTTPGSTKSFYGTISASNFILSDALEVKVDGVVDEDWSASTFDNKTHIKISPPSLSVGGRLQISIYDPINKITSNAIGFTCHSRMSVDSGKYMKINNAGVVVIDNIAPTLNLNNENLVDLYFADNNTLTTLHCDNNFLTSLDVFGCYKLKELQCHQNQLRSLDVSGCADLEVLNCFDNQLTSLDISHNILLNTLSCSYNQLPSLDISNCSYLINLFCVYNQLTSLNVSNKTNLIQVWCEYNQLTTINASGCLLLGIISCRNNQLTNLDISGCPSLGSIFCQNNQLTYLDVSNYINIIPDEFNCTNNPNLSLIKLPNWTSGSHSFNCTNLTTSCSNKGDIWTSINTTLVGLPADWWTLHNYQI